jgi:hypothetical protein
MTSGGCPRCPEAEGGPALGLDRDVDRDRQMATEGDAQGQQARGELWGVIPVAGTDVAHGPRRHAGRDRDLAHRRAPDASADDPPDRVDPVEAAMQDPFGKLTAGPPAPPAAQPPDPNQTALRSLAQLPPIAALADQPAAARAAAPASRPGHLLHVRRMMTPGTSRYQPVSDATPTPSSFSAAITSGFISIQSCRQQVGWSRFRDPDRVRGVLAVSEGTGTRRWQDGGMPPSG